MAFAATTIWEVRPGGADTNGGGFDPGVASPGTDFSIQDAVQFAYTDLAVDGADNTLITSAGRAFSAVDPGNFLHIDTTGGGAAWTVGWYEILSVTGVKAKLDRSPAAVGSTAGTAQYGGGFASPGQAMSLAVLSNTVYVKGPGTYVESAFLNVSGGRLNLTVGGTAANAPFHIVGYNTTRTLTNTDAFANLPVFDAAPAVGAFAHIALNSNFNRIRNIRMTNSAGGATGASYSIFFGGVFGLAERCTSDSMPFGYNIASQPAHLIDCVATNFTTAGFDTVTGGQGASFHGCYAANGTAIGFHGAGQFIRCIAYNNSGGSSDGFSATSVAESNYINCVAYGNGRDGFLLYRDGKCDNCVAVNNGGSTGGSAEGFGSVAGNDNPITTLYNCAGFGNKTSNHAPLPDYGIFNFKDLTADPFTNPAGGDFSLNSTVGGGAALKGVGYPSSFFTLNSSSFLDIGAVQSQSTPGTYVTVTSNHEPSTPGQSVTFTATVTVVGGGTATGTVQFLIDGVNFGTPVTLVGGVAVSGATTTLATGTRTITAVYTPSGSFQASTGTLFQVVQIPATVLPVGRLFRTNWDADPVGFAQELAALAKKDASLSNAVNVLRDVLPQVL